MPRRNHTNGKTRQHPKKQRMAGRPRGWHRKSHSPGINKTTRWLFGEGMV